MPIDRAASFNIGLIHYLAEERLSYTLQTDQDDLFRVLNNGITQATASYKSNVPSTVHVLSASKDQVWDASTILLPLITSGKSSNSCTGNIVASEYQSNERFNLQVTYCENSCQQASLTVMHRAFRLKFNRTFGASIPKYAAKACRLALSNMLGSISYFYGTSYVLKDGYFDRYIMETPPFELFTDIPSRATFPRGFLWDSGFHHLLISEWNPRLSLEILESWASRIEHNGWVAREQVPGCEARRAVPVDYIVQNTKHANPPALLISILKLARNTKNRDDVEAKLIKHKLRGIVPQFEKNIKWLIRTQRGLIHPHFCNRLAGSRSCSQVLKLPAFRWRGRSKYHNLNSGLDDYPRGDFANKYELHVDLACWIAFGAKSMLELCELLDHNIEVKWKRKFAKIKRHVLYALDHLHWDEERNIYSDITISSNGDMMYAQHQGYVNLFPLLFGFIDIDSDKLKASLDLIEDPRRLWTPYGLRSLSKSDSYYMKGDQYWTGPIWININYLVLAALKNHYMKPEGKHYEQVSRIYKTLRNNIVENMVSSFHSTHTIWEQYSDVDGQGMRSRPFTGWSALLVLIAAEHF